MTRFREHRGIDVFEGRRLITRAMVNYWKAWEEIGTSRFTMKMHRLIHGPFSSKCQKNSNAIKSKGEIWIRELTYSFMEHTPRRSKQIKDLWWTARLLSKIPPFYGSNQHARFLIKSPWNHMTSNFEQEHYNYTTSSSSSSQLLHDPCKMLKSKRRNLKVFEDLFQDIYVCVCVYCLFRVHIPFLGFINICNYFEWLIFRLLNHKHHHLIQIDRMYPVAHMTFAYSTTLIKWWESYWWYATSLNAPKYRVSLAIVIQLDRPSDVGIRRFSGNAAVCKNIQDLTLT